MSCRYFPPPSLPPALIYRHKPRSTHCAPGPHPHSVAAPPVSLPAPRPNACLVDGGLPAHEILGLRRETRGAEVSCESLALALRLTHQLSKRGSLSPVSQMGKLRGHTTSPRCGRARARSPAGPAEHPAVPPSQGGKKRVWAGVAGRLEVRQGH